jgi:transposase
VLIGLVWRDSLVLLLVESRTMMGFQIAPAQLFYNFCLDDHVPADHLLRRIGRFLDLERVRSALKPFYSSVGRPSVDPELMRMLIVGYCFGIRSERRLCEEVHLNLACRLGLDGKVPDHATLSRNRHGRFRQSDILRHLFETVVERCLAEGLVGGEGFAVDASLVAADANKQRSIPGDQWQAQDHSAHASRAVREYLGTVNDAAFGAASPVTPKFVSPSDPAAQWTGAHKGHAFFAYAANYLIDSQNAIILDLEATRAIRQAEVSAARTMLDRTAGRFGLKPQHLAADSAYGSGHPRFQRVHRFEPALPCFLGSRGLVTSSANPRKTPTVTASEVTPRPTEIATVRNTSAISRKVSPRRSRYSAASVRTGSGM